MIYVFNKSKILSYVIACSFVLMIFTFHDSIVQNKNVELIKVSSNILENNTVKDLKNMSNNE